MKTIFVLFIASMSFSILSGCAEEDTRTTHTIESTNPVNSYLDNRLDAIQNAKAALNKSDTRTKEQDDAAKALVK